MLRICAKCNHPNPDATGSDVDACPACGAIYAKVQAFGVKPEQAVGAPRAAARRSVRVDPSVPFIDRLRTESHYPAFRTVVGVFAILGYVVAGLTLLGAVIAGWRGGGGAAAIIGGLVFACVICIFSKVAKEASLMLADLSDAMVRMAERQER